jgi:xylulokinase
VIVLTLDLGTSATKAALWDGAELLALTRVPVPTEHPAATFAEQDPEDWWRSVVGACAQLRLEDSVAYSAIAAVGFTAARETFALVDDALAPLGPGILWSDERAGAYVDALGDPAEFRARTGVIASAGCCAAKVAWVRANDDTFPAARWVLAPRDLVVARLTGEVITDETLASRTGLYALDDTTFDGAVLRGADSNRLPRVVPPATTIPIAPGTWADALGLPAGVRVVLGAGDRQCEVLGVGADVRTPMVSWGTTANVSVPHPGPAAVLPTVAQVSRGALGGFVVEAGLSAAGAAVAWLATLTGRPHDVLLADAAGVDPGAAGVIALPWFAGARAPWWQAGAHAAFLGLTSSHGPAELARAVIEGVALDVARCLELVAPQAELLALAGGGATSDVWLRVLGGVTGLPLQSRALDDAASVGARLLVSAAFDEGLTLDDVSSVTSQRDPEPELVVDYERLRERADAVAQGVVELGA